MTGDPQAARLQAITRCMDAMRQYDDEDDMFSNWYVELHKLLYGLWPGEDKTNGPA
jgi:hypothetical protein